MSLLFILTFISSLSKRTFSVHVDRILLVMHLWNYKTRNLHYDCIMHLCIMWCIMVIVSVTFLVTCILHTKIDVHEAQYTHLYEREPIMKFISACSQLLISSYSKEFTSKILSFLFKLVYTWLRRRNSK